MKTATIKLIAIALLVIPVLLLAVFRSAPVLGAVTIDDPAADFKDKYKCAACHLPNATKFYDPAKSDDEHVQAILKGKKGEKPPYMPSYEAKGMTEDGAKALAAYMKSLRTAK